MIFAKHFLKLTNDELQKHIRGFSPEVEAIFRSYVWHGNLRELKNVVKRATLLCDTDHAVAEAYGVWKEKSMYGKKYMGTERTTFVIDPLGKIQAVFRKVKPAEHTDLLRAAL